MCRDSLGGGPGENAPQKGVEGSENLNPIIFQ